MQSVDRQKTRPAYPSRAVLILSVIQWNKTDVKRASFSPSSGRGWRGPRPFLRFIKASDLRAGFGFPPKAELARPTEKACPTRFPPGNSEEFQGTGPVPKQTKAVKRILFARFQETGPVLSHFKAAQRISNAKKPQLLISVQIWSYLAMSPEMSWKNSQRSITSFGGLSVWLFFSSSSIPSMTA